MVQVRELIQPRLFWKTYESFVIWRMEKARYFIKKGYDANGNVINFPELYMKKTISRAKQLWEQY